MKTTLALPPDRWHASPSEEYFWNPIIGRATIIHYSIIIGVRCQCHQLDIILRIERGEEWTPSREIIRSDCSRSLRMALNKLPSSTVINIIRSIYPFFIVAESKTNWHLSCSISACAVRLLHLHSATNSPFQQQLRTDVSGCRKRMHE